MFLDCKTTFDGKEYIGKIAVTASGETCELWKNREYNVDDFPDDSLEEAGNNCRNPDNSTYSPWCFVSGGDTWDYCDVPLCTSEQGK